ncbi:MAG: hypothetical protein LBN21_08140 [Treponema sp.]|jgi:hypothetical protein|nr:hypothetical protein [Treponema sp.]
MNKRINFEDNIFILEQRIRIIRDVLALDPDPDLFLDKTIDDVVFIDAALNTLLGSLVENTRLLEREEELDSFQDLELLFSRVLSELLDGSGSISLEDFPMIREKLTRLKAGSQERRKTIDRSGGTTETAAFNPVVSSDELNELLKDF